MNHQALISQGTWFISGAPSSHAIQSERGGEGQVWTGRHSVDKQRPGMDKPEEAEGWPGCRVTRVPWRQLSAKAAVSQGSSNRAGRGSPGEPSRGRAQHGSLALAGSEARGPPRSDWSRCQGPPWPGSRRAHSCHQSGQADPLPSGRMTPVTRPTGDPPSSMNSPLSISVPVLRVCSFPEPENHPAHCPSQQLSTLLHCLTSESRLFGSSVSCLRIYLIFLYIL